MLDAILDVLSGRYDSPEADFFCMNAAAALYLCGLAVSYAKGVELAKEAVASGRALDQLNHLREYQGSSPINNSR